MGGFVLTVSQILVSGLIMEVDAWKIGKRALAALGLLNAIGKGIDAYAAPAAKLELLKIGVERIQKLQVRFQGLCAKSEIGELSNDVLEEFKSKFEDALETVAMFLPHTLRELAIDEHTSDVESAV